MSITSAKSGATGISLALDNNFMEPIATILVGSDTQSITFNDIPQGYKNLQIRGIAQVTFGSDPGAYGGLSIRFNGDASTNYTRHLIGAYQTGIEAYGQASTDTALLERFPYRLTNNNVYGTCVADILDYSNTNKFKTMRNIGGWDSNGTGEMYYNSSVWMSNNPITSVTIYQSTYKIKQYSRFSLYGIKG